MAHDLLRYLSSGSAVEFLEPPLASVSFDDASMVNPSHHMPRAWHPFGGRAMGALGEAVVVASLPDTSLNLTLLGILYVEHATGVSPSTRALIKSPTMEEKKYHAHEVLPGDVTIVAIYPDRVILERQGGLETLRLPKKLLPIYDGGGKGDGGGKEDGGDREDKGALLRLFPAVETPVFEAFVGHSDVRSCPA